MIDSIYTFNVIVFGGVSLGLVAFGIIIAGWYVFKMIKGGLSILYGVYEITQNPLLIWTITGLLILIGSQYMIRR